MANPKILIPFIQRWEGGFANDPLDKGGATMAGITIATYRTWCAKNGKAVPETDDLRNITQPQWDDIFTTMYWNRWKASDIHSQSIANILVDWLWTSGSYGITIPQRLVRVASDGVVGPITLNAINTQNAKELFSSIRTARLQYINDICTRTPSNEKFRRGWLNRLNDILYHETNTDHPGNYFRSL